MKKINEMTKYKAIAIFLIVAVSVVFVYLIILLFQGKRVEDQTTDSIPTPPIVDSDLHDEFMREFNESTDRVGHTYTLSNGQEVTILIPRGIDPPPPEVVEEMYWNR